MGVAVVGALTLTLTLSEQTTLHWYSKGNVKSGAPNYDVTELHVRRMTWVAEYWLSVAVVVASRGPVRYPILVPEWRDRGYLENPSVEGGVLVHLRSLPKVTYWPGVGIRVVKCTRCKPQPGKGKCEGCPCAVEGGGRCSQLCKCELICRPEEHRHALEENEIVLSDSSSGEESDSDASVGDSEGEEDMRGTFSGLEPMDIGGFDPEHVMEYEQLLETEQGGQGGRWGGSTQGFMSNPGFNERSV